ncbi:uncharacterized protein LOC119024457 isoform X4 [Acanthopagrus latus]|uniref:uncharacterized protein LOC119024457 isoform X4 n=1 Tax=Acanthopagrus latus TaxID=8177 RepID=UPI00187C489F|nr:uncharacterized protein LOC119024457 isoform X4 [Acanthopagrus latus]
MMISCSGALAELKTGPVYFFDQPTKRNRMKGTRSRLYFNVANEDTAQSQENDNKEGVELTPRLSGETCGEVKPDTASDAPNIKDQDPVDAYKRAAPQLLNDLARLLSQHKWAQKACIPRGIVNILNCSWQELTAGAVQQTNDKPGGPRGSLKLDEDCDKNKKEAGERNSVVVVEHVGPTVKKPHVSSNPRMKKHKQNNKRAHNSTTFSFSVSSDSSKHPGWIVQPTQPSCDDPQWIRLCQWVVDRLQAARNNAKLQTADQHMKPLIRRHYGDAKETVKDRTSRRKKAQPATLVNGLPQIPEVKQQDPARQKLHYRINDGSSFIYYPSGCMAVCQSCSGLPGGGFYTNVFSDSEFPVIMATITAFGHGAVTHPLSCSITAVWDQDGGFICDHHGNITKDWSWQTGRTPREKIVIQLSDLISVRLLSGTSAMLRFSCNKESVHLPLPALAKPKEMPCLQTPGKLNSEAAQDPQLAGKTKSPAVVLKNKRNLRLTPVSVRSREVLQMVREVEGLEELSTQRRRGGHVGRELKRLQQRVRNILDDWMDYYRVAIGIKCPDMERMPDAPLRTRLRREVQSAALPSLNPPEWVDAKPVQPEEDGDESQELHGHRSAETCIKLPRTPKKGTKAEPRVTQIGPLQIHGSIKLESLVIPHSPDLQPSAVTNPPARPSFTSSAPVTVCPALLRAALQGEGGCRRCCCSATLMPAVTDLEYDAFIMGQPPHSQQILVVCVTPASQHFNTHVAPGQEVLERLYRRRNKQRTTPCTQCQMDSFRLVRYEMSTGKQPSCGAENILLQQRHNAAPGMVLMYIRGKLLFVGYVFSDHSRSVRDLQKQISRSRGDYRLGLSLPSDYKLRYDCATFASVHLIYCKKLNHLSVTLITDHSNSMNIEENCQRASWNLKISPVKLLFKGQVETTRIDSVHSRPFLAVIQ